MRRRILWGLPWFLVLALVVPSRTFASASGSLDPFFGLSGRDTVRSSTFYTFAVNTGGVVITLDGSPLPLGPSERGLVLPDGKLLSLNSYLRFEYDFCRTIIGVGYDPTFGGGGTGCAARIPGSSGAFAAPARQSDGKLLIAGWTEAPAYDIFVARYSAGGILDTTFGTSGITVISFGPGLSAHAYGLVVQPDDRIIVGGQVTNGPFNSWDERAFGLARLDADGALDPSFGTGGLVTTTFGVRPGLRGLALQPDGRILAVGDDDFGDSSCQEPVPTFIARYLTDGSLDPSFGAGGVVTDVFGPLGGGCGPNEVLVQDDDKILVGGSAVFRDPLLSFQPAVARYLPDGTRDGSFGRGGLTWTIVPYGFFRGISGLARQPDGGIVAVGPGHRTVVRWFGGTCGDSELEAGEECDDGNTVSGDGCDANCCTADSDGDGVCDSIDACTDGQAISGLRLALTRLGLGGDGFKPIGDTFTLKGKLVVPPAVLASVDPSTKGLRLLIDDSTGNLLDLSVPGGAYDAREFGWRSKGTVALYLDRHMLNNFKGYLAPYHIDKVKVIVVPERSMIKLLFHGKHSRFYEVLPAEPQLTTTLVLDPPIASGTQCLTETLNCTATSPIRVDCE